MIERKDIDMVELLPMNEDFFQRYIKESFLGFARKMIKVGSWNPDEVEKKSQEQLESLLPEGLQTPGHEFFRVMDTETDQKVGILWIQKRKMEKGKVFFIYDIMIDESYRRKGYGQAALVRLEEKAASLDCNEIWLNVFADNKGAKRLYDKLGYEVQKTHLNESGGAVSFLMMKRIIR
jgi:ribosomal protein S18 acetylase RimI-like enzyme